MTGRSLAVKFVLLKALYYAIFTALASFAVAYLQTARGLSDGQASLLITLNTVGAFAGQFLFGRLCDLFHTHKKLFLLLLLLDVPVGLGLYFLPAQGAMYALYFALGLVQTPLFVIIDTWFLAAYPNDAALYGKVLASGSCAYAALSFLYGRLLDRAGYGIMPWCLLAMLAVTFVLSLTIPDFSGAAASSNNAGGARGARLPLTLVAFLGILLGLGVCSNTYNLLPMLMDHVGGTLAQLGLAMSLSGLAQIPFMLLSGRVQRIPPRLRITLSGLIFLTTALCFAFGGAPFPLIFGACICGAGYGILLPAYRSVIARLAPASLSTTAQSLADAVYLSLGSVLSSGFASLTSGAFGLKMPILTLAGVLVLALIALWAMGRRIEG